MASKRLSIQILALIFIVASLSIALGAVAWSRSSAYFLPIPISVTASATMLPIFTIVIPFLTEVISNARSLRDNIWILRATVDQLLAIIPVIIATLVLSYISPSQIVSCRLEEQWQSYFRSKNALAIRAIQDGLRCCGFRSIHDRAWPFKDSNNKDNACEAQLGYTRSCLVPWRAKEQNAAWMLFTAAILAFILKVGVLYIVDRVYGSRGQASVALVNGSNPRMLPYSDHDRVERGDEADANNGNPDDGTEHANPLWRESGPWSRNNLIEPEDSQGDRGLSVHPSGLGRLTDG